VNLAEIARLRLSDAELKLAEAEAAHRKRNARWAEQHAQEAIEYALKSALSAIGIEHPKSHDPGAVLSRYARRFPEWFRRQIPEFSAASADLLQGRDERLYPGPGSTAPTREESEHALEAARAVVGAARKLVEERS
jgi:HEPN domain-containing protein